MEQEQQKPKSVEAPQERIASLEDASHALSSFGTVIFFVIVFQIVLMFGLNLYQSARVSSLDNNLNEMRSTLNSADYQTVNKQVEEVISGNEKLRTVLASKVKWSSFYSLLNQSTPQDVVIRTINVTSDGSFQADGETSSMSSLAKAIVAWNGGTSSVQSPFNTVVLNSNNFVSSGDQRRVGFTISGQINLGVLR